MTCSTCEAMCATTEAQYEQRQRNMAAMPDAMPLPCPKCGSIEWATSREKIGIEPPKQRWWRRPPSWAFMRNAAILVCASNVLCIVMASDWWVQWVNLFLLGFMFSGALNSHGMITITKSLARMRAAFDEVHGINQALIEGRVMVHVAQIARDDDDPPPLAPNKMN